MNTKFIVFFSLLLQLPLVTSAQVPEEINILIQNKAVQEGDTLFPSGPLKVQSIDTVRIECKVLQIEVFHSRKGRSVNYLSSALSPLGLNSLAATCIPGDQVVIMVTYKLYKGGQFYRAGKLTRKIIAG